MFNFKTLVFTLLLNASIVAGDEPVPPFLYKVISFKHWHESRHQSNVALSKMDESFIHLAKEDQIDQFVKKFWSKHKHYFILKLDTSKLKGKLVYETNHPDAKSKYYHLYNGSIPKSAVVQAREVN